MSSSSFLGRPFISTWSAPIALLLVAGSAAIGCSDAPAPTATPIKHVVVIFQENVSFDHYFATYPQAKNLPGEPAFTAKPGTPTVNNLLTPLDVTNQFAPLAIDLLNNNPNATNIANGANASNPFRLDRATAATSSQNHGYDGEQRAFNGTAMDLFPLVNNSKTPMAYFDGNTVTAYWNYAQHYALNDNFYGTQFGPSSPGAINLISGQTNGVVASNAGMALSLNGALSNDGLGGMTMTGNPQPLGDTCSTRGAVTLGGKNVGDLLNDAKVSWGFFMGGFDLTVVNPNGTTGCDRSSASNITGGTVRDYLPHHQPFQYYASTSNPTHARPSSVGAIGKTYQADGKTPDPANHQYDIHDFFDAVSAGNFPAVSFLKAAAYQDGHAGYSSPLDEQSFVVDVVNFVQSRPEWANTLIIIAYDDSDGWYDHQSSPIVNPSRLASASTSFVSNGLTFSGPADWLNGDGACTMGTQQGTPVPAQPLLDYTGTNPVQGRCGYGPRLPLLLLSPYAKSNYVDHTLTDQTSILRFIEDNWLSSKRITGSFDALAGSILNMLDFTKASTPKLRLDPSTGLPMP